MANTEADNAPSKERWRLVADLRGQGGLAAHAVHAHHQDLALWSGICRQSQETLHLQQPCLGSYK